MSKKKKSTKPRKKPAKVLSGPVGSQPPIKPDPSIEKMAKIKAGLKKEAGEEVRFEGAGSYLLPVVTKEDVIEGGKLVQKEIVKKKMIEFDTVTNTFKTGDQQIIDGLRSKGYKEV